MKRALRTTTLGMLIVAVGAFSGCSLKMNDLDQQILTDYSPEWSTMKHDREQRVYSTVNALDSNFRQFNDDVDSVFFLDRPLRLNRMPVP